MTKLKKKSRATTTITATTNSYKSLVGSFLTVILTNNSKIHGALLWYDKTFLYLGDDPNAEQFRIMVNHNMVAIITVGGLDDLELMDGAGPDKGEGVH